MRPLLFIIVVATAMCFATDELSARTAACPCGNPCPCSPCTCGEGKGGSSKPSQKKGSDTTHQPKTNKGQSSQTDAHGSETRQPKTTSKNNEPRHTHTNTDHPGHHGGRKEHDGHHGGGSIGVDVGVSADFSVIGRRTAEPDPFAAGPGIQPVRHTEFKTRAPNKPSGNNPKDPFKDVQVTGEQAKEENNPSGPINVDNDRPAPGPAINRSDDPPPTGEPAKEGNSPPGMGTGLDDGLPPPPLTEKGLRAATEQTFSALGSVQKNAGTTRQSR